MKKTHSRIDNERLKFSRGYESNARFNVPFEVVESVQINKNAIFRRRYKLNSLAHSTAWYHTTAHDTTWHRMTPHDTAWDRLTPHGTAQHSAWHRTAPHNTTHDTAWHHTALKWPLLALGLGIQLVNLYFCPTECKQSEWLVLLEF